MLSATVFNSMQKIIMYWRDIPSMVTAKQQRKRAKVMLPDRFQHAIDRAAMRAKKAGSDSYLEEWRREPAEVESALTLQEYVEQLAAQLDRDYDDARLSKIVKNKGFEPD